MFQQFSLQNYLGNSLGSDQNRQTNSRQPFQSQFANDYNVLNQNDVTQGS